GEIELIGPGAGRSLPVGSAGWLSVYLYGQCRAGPSVAAKTGRCGGGFGVARVPHLPRLHHLEFCRGARCPCGPQPAAGGALRADRLLAATAGSNGMKHSITQSMSWLHTWAGLVLGWALVAIFVTGTLAVFDREITQWMQPEMPVSSSDREQAVTQAIDYLREHHGSEARWQVQLPTERYGRLAVSTGEQRRGGKQTVLEPTSGEVLEV